MIKEFINFIKTGNVIEFAVAVILAGAISAVVGGFVSDIAMPIVGSFVGGVDFSDIKIVLSVAEFDGSGVEIKPENAIRIGAWINTIINLIIVGLILFFIVKAYNKLRKPAPDPAPAGPTSEELLAEIRDLLKK